MQRGVICQILSEFLIIHIGICHTVQIIPTSNMLRNPFILQENRSSKNPRHAASSTAPVINRYMQLMNSAVGDEYVL